MPKKSKTFSYVHIGLFTNRPKRLINFYQAFFGFKQEKVGLIDKKTSKQIFGLSYECKMYVLALDTLRLELFHPKSTKLKRSSRDIVGLNHWGFFVKDKHKFAEQLKKAGARIKKIKRPSGHFVYFVSDPDNNLIEIMEPPTNLCTPRRCT
ncbi:MAG TPA: VOC family protein [Candidatus Omnitrophica bacterium]|nr:VOC family protein [Candidatus Omnitrophota bacterium]